MGVVIVIRRRRIGVGVPGPPSLGTGASGFTVPPGPLSAAVGFSGAMLRVRTRVGLGFRVGFMVAAAFGSVFDCGGFVSVLAHFYFLIWRASIATAAAAAAL